jgi:hypothetical protein
LQIVFEELFKEWHGFCPQVIHTYYPMKELQLCLASALLCYAIMAQSSVDQINTASLLEVNKAFSLFTVTPQNGQAMLRWSAPSIKPEDFFIVEKSSDGLHYEMLSAMDATLGMDSVYSLVDNSLGLGTISYRIRITGKDGREICSKTINVNSTAAADFKFYPNPVDKLLIIRSSHPLTIQVVDAYGIVYFGQDVQAGMQIVNVSALQKGNYILKATDKATNTVTSQQLIKNN